MIKTLEHLSKFGQETFGKSLIPASRFGSECHTFAAKSLPDGGKMRIVNFRYIMNYLIKIQ